MRKWAGVLAVVLAAAVASPGFAGERGKDGAAAAGHDEKIANIRKLLHVMSGKQMKDMMDTMTRSSLSAIESRMPADGGDDPDARQAFAEFMKTLALGEKDIEEMLELMVPYYDKYLDDADVRALLAFYESPSGKKFVRVMPEMMAEMMPRIVGWTMDKLKGPTETLRKRLEDLREKRLKEKPGKGPSADPGGGPRG